ncbi:MAG: universal stress protein [Bacillota bacterium]
MFERIVVGLDGSTASERVLARLNDLRAVGTQSVALAWVVDVGITGGMAPNLVNGHVEWLREKAWQLKGFDVSWHAPVGFPGYEITRLAEELGASLVLIGSRGESLWRDAFLGSTASDTLRLSNVPVLIERTGQEDLIAPLRPLWERLLLATDVSAAAERAEAVTCKLAPVAREIVVLSVVDEGTGQEQLRRLEEAASEHIRCLVDRCSGGGLKVSGKTAVGIASVNIIRTAEEIDASLIIVGKRGRGRIRELLIGSTAEAVARRASRPVLVVPNRNTN